MAAYQVHATRGGALAVAPPKLGGHAGINQPLKGLDKFGVGRLLIVHNQSINPRLQGSVKKTPR